MVISFKTNEELSLNDIDCANLLEYTKDDNFTVEFLVKEKDINKTIKHEDKLNLKVEYEVF